MSFLDPPDLAVEFIPVRRDGWPHQLMVIEVSRENIPVAVLDFDSRWGFSGVVLSGCCYANWTWEGDEDSEIDQYTSEFFLCAVCGDEMGNSDQLRNSAPRARFALDDTVGQSDQPITEPLQTLLEAYGFDLYHSILLAQGLNDLVEEFSEALVEAGVDPYLSAEEETLDPSRCEALCTEFTARARDLLKQQG